MIDALGQRGAADTILAPLRPRIARLRPHRPVGLIRLLFQPFDPIIVPAPKWRRGDPSVPRSILGPIGHAVRQHLGPAAEAIETALHGHDYQDAAIVQVGATLWPSAAALLGSMSTPTDWAALTGLSADDCASISPMLAAVLQQAEPVQRLVDRAAAGEEVRTELLRPILVAALANGPEAAGMMVALLLARLPSPEFVLLAASRLTDGHASPGLYGAIDTAVETTIDHARARAEAALAGPAAEIDLRAAGLQVVHASELLDGLAAQPLRPERAAHVETCRRELEAICRRQFVTCMGQQLLEPLAEASAAPAVTTDLEQAARGLRHLQAAARRLGGSGSYDAALREAAGQIAGAGTQGGTALALADRVRLTELLVGPEAALALLDAAETVAPARA